MHFATSSAHKMPSMSFVSLKQQKEETLIDFMGRFNTDTLRINHLSPEGAMHAILVALKHKPFSKSLAKKPPFDMNELRAWAEKYIKLEEVSRDKA